MVKKYIKRPFVVEAMQFKTDSESITELLNFAKSNVKGVVVTKENASADIATLEGTIKADAGDYIVKGIAGEFYPCKPDIFHQLYEELQDEAANTKQYSVQSFIDQNKEHIDVGELSDGYHTFNELYHHRTVLFAVICSQNKHLAWKSRKHSDGSMYDGYFIVGIKTPEGDYTYHCQEKYWDMFDVPELDRAPEWDGHKPSDINRLFSLLK